MPKATHNPTGHLSTGDDLNPPHSGGLRLRRQTEVPSLLEEIEGRRPRKLCTFGRWLAAASKQDRADLRAAFTDRTISGQLIADVLSPQIEGWVVDDIRKHRRGVCPICPKTVECLNVAP